MRRWKILINSAKWSGAHIMNVHFLFLIILNGKINPAAYDVLKKQEELFLTNK